MRVKVKLIDGDKICQLSVGPVPVVYFDEVPMLDDTERGDGGFGSTGIN